MAEPKLPDAAEDAPWKIKAAAKRAAEKEKIPPEWQLAPKYLTGHAESDDSVMHVPAECGILSTAEIEITEKYDAVSLAKAVQSRSIKAVDVATAFCKRAAIAQQLTNCLTETFFSEAIERGKYLDRFLEEHGRPVGPLHGVPISLKDPFNYRGVASTLGIVSFLDRPVASENSFLVDMLLDLGAILYCKTNIPQSMMTGDSDNNVFGRTLNPHKLKLGAGGSSGGEGALVAMRGSILGVGTDIGGSIRIPALCCGTYGYKPSTHRIPSGGQSFCSRRGSPGFPAVAGPLANTFEDLAFFASNVIGEKPWNTDPTAIPFPWRTEVANATPPNLRVGYFVEDPDFKVHPPVARALETTAQKITAGSLTIVPLKHLPSLQAANELVFDSFSLDNSKEFLQHINVSGEPIIPSLARTFDTVNKRPNGFTVSEVFDFNVARGQYKAAWNKVFVENKLDVILCPAAQATALPHDNFGKPPYTAIWNLLEYPGVIIPVGKADSKIDVNDLARPDPQKPYDADTVHGAPTTIQLVARSYHDEELIAASRLINQCLRR